jgi:hypothetical protein
MAFAAKKSFNASLTVPCEINNNSMGTVACEFVFAKKGNLQ